MSEKHRWYDVIVAWASGEKIQGRTLDDSGKILCDWKDFNPDYTPNFTSKFTAWRIKPKTKIKKYRMALVYTPRFNPTKKVIAVDITSSCLNDPVQYGIIGFIKWIGDIVEVEIEE